MRQIQSEQNKILSEKNLPAFISLVGVQTSSVGLKATTWLHFSWNNSVFSGQEGPPGRRGNKGPRGQPGEIPVPPKKSGFLFSRHSQNRTVPQCPNGSSFIYSGYSLLFINGYSRAHGQDLGMFPQCLSVCRSVSKISQEHWPWSPTQTVIRWCVILWYRMRSQIFFSIFDARSKNSIIHFNFLRCSQYVSNMSSILSGGNFEWWELDCWEHWVIGTWVVGILSGGNLSSGKYEYWELK